MYQYEPSSEDEMLHNAFAVLRRIIKGRTSASAAIMAAKLHTPARLFAEQKFGLQGRKSTQLGRAIVMHYIDCFEIASDTQSDLFVRLRANSERVQRLANLAP